MIKNYFKIAWRNLIKNKATSLINIGGLAVGMAVAILIGLWIWDELSFDKSHRNYDHIAQVMQNYVRAMEATLSILHYPRGQKNTFSAQGIKTSPFQEISWAMKPPKYSR